MSITINSTTKDVNVVLILAERGVYEQLLEIGCLAQQSYHACEKWTNMISIVSVGPHEV